MARTAVGLPVVVISAALALSCGQQQGANEGSAGTTDGQPLGVARAALEDCPEIVEIDTCAELQGMQNGCYEYRMTDDIDCTGFDYGDDGGFMPLGGFDPWVEFSSGLNGQGHVITGLTINRPSSNAVGLYGNLSGHVTHVGLVDVNINGFDSVGGLAAFVTNGAVVSEVYVTGTVNGYSQVGGIAGRLHGEASLIDSYALAAVTAVDDEQCGLVVGKLTGDSTFTHLYSAGTIINCSPTVLGYLYEGTGTSSFFDCDVAGGCSDDEAESTATMQSPAHFVTAGWDLSNIWGFSASATYPCLRWQPACLESDVDTDEDGTPDALDGCPVDADKTAPGACGCGFDDASAACVAGSSCQEDQDCLDATTDVAAWTCSELFPGGFCTRPCGAAGACPTGTICEPEVGCVPECSSDDDAGAGAACIRSGLECLDPPSAGLQYAFCRPTCERECLSGRACDAETDLCRDCAASDSVCDGIDEDCDDLVDEDYVATETSCGVGSCATTGDLTCNDGELSDDCAPGTPSGPDTTCNNQDEDCDAVADEAYVPVSTTCGVGACSATGTSSCAAGTVQNNCTPGNPAASDTTCDGIDDDCSGVADEDYVSTPTTCSTGACAATGSLICVSGSVVDTCSPGAPSSSDTTCDGVDDDCDSAVDDDYQPQPSSCQQAGCLATGFVQCVSGAPQDQCSTLGTCIVETDCNDNVDNDNDAAEDCADPDCATDSLCIEAYCDNDVDDNGNGLTDCDDPGCDGAPGCIAEICGNSLDDDNDGMTDCADLDCNEHASCMTLPTTDLSEVAPPLDPTVAVKALDALSYLFEGEDPIQRGVAPGTMEPERIALLSGHVMVSGGAPLAGVMVDILGRPELGLTYTNEDGDYHMAVNAGGTLAIRFKLGGYIPAQRAVTTLFNASAATDDVILLPRSSTVTELDTSGAATSMQIAMGDAETDSDGTRRAVILVPPGTEAQVYDATGAVVPVIDFNLRITEHTVGAHGDLSMPAALPPSTAYTYAVDITGDEALYKHHGVDTLLSNPVIFYADNFMNIAAGSATPSGYFDNEAGIWKEIPNGIVLTIVGETAGVAAVDLTGDGIAADSTALAAAGITNEELQALSTLYDAGKSLRRVALPHLSTFDHNDGVRPASNTPPPPLPPDKKRGDDPHEPKCGSPQNSTIDCFSGTLGESVEIPGTPYSLHYETPQVLGWLADNQIRIPLKTTGFSGLPLNQVVITITPPLHKPVVVSFSSLEAPDEYVWNWDGLDEAGRALKGTYEVRVSVAYEYSCIIFDTKLFGYTGVTPLLQPNGQLIVPRDLCTAFQTQRGTYSVQARDLRPEGLGAWSLDVHHRFLPEQNILQRGDGGSFQSALLPGTEEIVRFNTDYSPSFTFTPDGALYFVGDATGTAPSNPGVHGVWRKVGGDAPTLVAPSNVCEPGEHSANKLCRADLIAASPDGRIYVTDRGTYTAYWGTPISRIMELDPETGTLKRLAHPVFRWPDRGRGRRNGTARRFGSC